MTTVLAALIFLPWLGAVGLWDPWETHYAEVAREMIERGDFLHPHWEKSYFFSKPVLTMWLQALGMLAATRWSSEVFGLALIGLGGALAWLRRGVRLGPVLLSSAMSALVLIFLMGRTTVAWKLGALTGAQPGALPLTTEWGVRLPFAAVSIAAVGLLTWALSRAVSARVGVFAGLIFTTMPLTSLLCRQSVTDPLLVGATVIGVSCALVAMFDVHTQHEGRWWYGAWVGFAAATLAKGWLGFLLPAFVFGAYLVFFVARRDAFKSEWMALRRLLARPLSWGLAAAALVGFTAWQSGRASGSVFMAGLGGLGAPEWLALTWGALALWVVTTLLVKDDGSALPPVLGEIGRAHV
jgi:4-amino-4-deoxy-L-arabinose transferase-like glycosyltransferase